MCGLYSNLLNYFAFQEFVKIMVLSFSVKGGLNVIEVNSQNGNSRCLSWRVVNRQYVCAQVRHAKLKDVLALCMAPSHSATD